MGRVLRTLHATHTRLAVRPCLVCLAGLDGASTGSRVGVCSFLKDAWEHSQGTRECSSVAVWLYEVEKESDCMVHA